MSGPAAKPVSPRTPPGFMNAATEPVPAVAADACWESAMRLPAWFSLVSSGAFVAGAATSPMTRLASGAASVW